MTHALVRIANLGTQKAPVSAHLPFCRVDKNDVIVTSALGPEAPLNDHLVWLWSMLMHHRRYLKKLVANGAIMTCECRVGSGPISMRPNGAEMLHILGIPLTINAKD